MDKTFAISPGNTITIKKRFLNISEKLDFSWNVEFFIGINKRHLNQNK